MERVLTYFSSGIRLFVGIAVLMALLFLFLTVGIIALGIAVIGGLIAWLFGARVTRRTPPQDFERKGNGIIIDHE